MGKQLRILTYDAAGQHVDEWADDVGPGVELAWKLGMPYRAHVPVVKGSPHLAMDRLWSGGQPAFIELDASDWGLDPWLGQVEGLDLGSEGTTRQVAINGPQQWLDNEAWASVPGRTSVNQSAGTIFFDAVAKVQEQVDVRLDPTRQVFIGQAVQEQLKGGTLWKLYQDLAGRYGEELQLSAQPRKCRLNMSWSSPLDARDVSGLVQLREGVNCTWSGSPQLRASLEELTMAGRSWDMGSKTRGVAVSAPGGRVLGMRGSLLAQVSSITQVLSASAGPAMVDPTTPTLTALRAQAEVQLRRLLTPYLRAQVVVLDPDLWPLMRTGDIVQTYWPSDDLGVYQDAQARVRTLTYNLGEDRKLVASVDLWATGMEGGE